VSAFEVNALVVFYLACGCLIVGIVWHHLDKQGHVAAASRQELALYLVSALALLTVWPLVVLYFSTLGRKR